MFYGSFLRARAEKEDESMNFSSLLKCTGTNSMQASLISLFPLSCFFKKASMHFCVFAFSHFTGRSLNYGRGRFHLCDAFAHCIVMQEARQGKERTMLERNYALDTALLRLIITQYKGQLCSELYPQFAVPVHTITQLLCLLVNFFVMILAIFCTCLCSA